MIRLAQLTHSHHGRKVGIVQQDQLRLLADTSIYRLAERAFTAGITLEQAAQTAPANEVLDYRAVHQGQSPWTLLPAFDHPDEPGRCLVTGTGLTHKGSAEKRQAMHAAQKSGNLTDSMRMYQLGLQGGRPAPGEIGVSPEWFYKGCGT